MRDLSPKKKKGKEEGRSSDQMSLEIVKKNRKGSRPGGHKGKLKNPRPQHGAW